MKNIVDQQKVEEDEEEILKFTDEKPIERIKPLQIFPYQLEHFKNLLKILRDNLSYCDVSVFGAGKGIIAIAVAITFKMGILLVGPKTVIPTWTKNCKLYGVPLYGTLTYSALRGTEKS